MVVTSSYSPAVVAPFASWTPTSQCMGKDAWLECQDLVLSNGAAAAAVARTNEWPRDEEIPLHDRNYMARRSLIADWRFLWQLITAVQDDDQSLWYVWCYLITSLSHK